MVHVLVYYRGTVEFAAYIHDPEGHGCQTFQSILAPVFLGASVYISFTGMLRSLKAESLTPLNCTLQTSLFIIGHIVSFGLQIAGLILQLVLDNKNVGTAIVIVGFVLQLIVFG